MSQQRDDINRFTHHLLASFPCLSRLLAGLHVKPRSVSGSGKTRRLFSRAKTFNTHHGRRHALVALHPVHFRPLKLSF